MERSYQYFILFLFPSESGTIRNVSSLERLNAQLALRLPSYMLLSDLIEIEGIPLTTNGKVDRKFLMKLAEERVDKSNDGGAPISTEIEKEVAAVWEKVLNIPFESMNKFSSFTELGGHSLSAIKAQNLLKTNLNLSDLPLKTVLGNSTLSELARALESLGATPSVVKNADSNVAESAPITDWATHRYDPFPLTPIQQAYFIGRDPLVELGGVATHAYQEFDVPEWLTPEILTAVINMLITRHDGLRIIFEQDKDTGIIEQRVLKEEESGQFHLDVLDLSEETDEFSEQMILQVRSELSHQVLDPAIWPLFDIRMTKTSTNSILHISLDALIIDFYSSAILSADTLAILAFIRKNGLSGVDVAQILPPLTTTFRELILTELCAKEQDSANEARSRQYWVDRASSFPKSAELPLQKRPSQIQVSKFEREESIIDANHFKRLEQLSHQHKVMPTTILAYAFAKSLSRYSANSDFIINLTLFQRPLDVLDAEKVVGDFTSSLLLEYHDMTDNGPSGLSGIKQLNEQLLEDLSHSSFTGIDMIRYLRSNQGKSREFSFPVVMTSVLNDVGASNDMSKLLQELGKPHFSISQTPQVWIDFQAVKDSSGLLVLRWDYLADLFPPNMIRNMHTFFTGLVQDFCREPAWLETFSPDKHFHVHVPHDLNARLQINSTSTAFSSSGKLLHSALFESSLRSPDATAIIDASENRTLTYAQLARAVYCIREKMRKNLFQKGAVAIMIPKGWRQIAAVLAVLCNGSAYIPIATDLPVNRIRLILEQAACTNAIVLDRDLTTGLDDKLSACISLEDLDLDLAMVQQPQMTLDFILDSLSDSMIEPNSTAYIIFTSGSTGVPKGVVISHQAALNTIADVVQKWSLKEKDVFFNVSNLNFDLSVFDIFGSLFVGGAILLPQDFKDPEVWAQLIITHGVTVWNSVPMIVQMLMEMPREILSKVLETLELIMMSGDWIPISLARTLLAFGKEKQRYPALISLGGATEASIWSIYHEITEADVSHDAKSIPYGKPLANQQMHVGYVDNKGNWLDDAPTFAIGHLFISGVGLANGYTDPDKTAHAFITHPATGQRMYRTGDLARYMANGELEFIGRSDFQVKIRGHRIELDEIQYFLELIPEISRAVALVESDNIVAVIVPKIDSIGQISIDKINAQLSLHLPHYMLADHVLEVEQLKLSNNHKIDRKSLSGLVQKLLTTTSTARKGKEVGQAPSSKTEITLAKLWIEILGVDEKVSITTASCFFELGGHSLLAIRLKGAIEREFGVTVPLKKLFEQPCQLDELSELVETLSGNTIVGKCVSGSFDKIQADSEPYEPFELTPIQAAYLLGRGDQIELGNVSAHSYVEYQLPPNVFSEHPSEVSTTISKIIDKLVERHDALRIVFDLQSQKQRVLPIDNVKSYTVRTVDLSSETDEMVVSMVREQTRSEMESQVLDATTWPLFDVAVTILPQREIILHVSLDMLIMDFASSAILAQEFVFLASSLRKTSESVNKSDFDQLVLPRSTFKQHVAYSSRMRLSEEFARMRQYWASRASDFPGGPDLTRTISSDSSQKPVFDRREATIKKDDFDNLKRVAAMLKLNLGSIFATAFAKVLYRFSSQPHFAINLTLFSRHGYIEQNDVIGDFTSSLLLEFDERKSPPTFFEEVQQTEERLVQDIENSSFSGVEFIRLLNIERKEKLFYSVVMTMFLHETSFEDAVIKMFGEPVYAITQTPQVDLDFQCLRDMNGDLTIRFDFLKDMFEASYIEDLHTSLLQFIQRLCKVQPQDWSSSSSALNLSVPSVRDRILGSFNETNMVFDKERKVDLLHEGFYRSFMRDPDAVAVVDIDGSVTYAELAALMADLCSRLAREGVKISSKQANRVAVILPKGRYQVAACLAILSSGFAYVPIEEDAPSSRVAAILQEAECKAVIVSQNILSSKESENWKSLCSTIAVDPKSFSKIEGSASSASILTLTEWKNVDPESEAYLIFTSGSTGKPKGVIIQHAAVVNTINDLVQRWSLSHTDTFLGLAKLSFDLSVFDIFAPITVGAKVVFPQPAQSGEAHDPQEWLSLISEHSVTIWNSVPMMVQMILATRATKLRQRLASLRVMLLSGDRFPVKLAEALFEVCPSKMLLYSGGGATEASVWSVLHHVTPQDFSKPSNNGLIPYGAPMYNQTMFILQQESDQNSWRHAPALVPGKLFIGGQGLARGYTDKVKSKASFFNIPELGRVYDTGDVVRFLPDGKLEFLGRSDLQVKIRGHRIELEEINHRLRLVKGVNDSVIKVINEQIVGFVVPQDSMPSVEAYSNYELISDDLERLSLKADIADKDISLTMRQILSAQSPDITSTISIDRNGRNSKLIKERQSHYSFEAESPHVNNIADSYQRAQALSNKIIFNSKHVHGLESIRPRQHTIKDIVSVLSALLCVPKDTGGHKYRYPSAGATYSVNILVRCNGVEGLDDGLFIFDPKSANLILICENASKSIKTNSNVELIFVSYLPAIAPLYGSATDRFCRLENGYMLGAMAVEASRLHLRLQVENDVPNTASIAPELNLDSKQVHVVGQASLLALSTDFSSTEGINVLASFENASKQGYKLGIERGDQNWAQTQMAWDLSDQPLAFHHNAQLLRSVSSIVTLTSDIDPIHSAAVAQIFMEEGIKFGLGWTQVPWICDEWSTSYKASFDRTPDIILVGGKVNTLPQEPIDSTSETLAVVNGRLSDFLPNYMLLNSLISVPGSLPLSGNGKIDHARLKAIAEAQESTILSSESHDVAPSTEQEVIIAQAWSEALDIPVPMLKLNSNFFQLGGNSLSSIKLQSLLRQKLGCDLDLKTIFRKPTIKGLDAVISSDLIKNRSKTGTGLHNVQQPLSLIGNEKDENDPFPLTSIQEAYLLGRSSAFELGNIATHAYIEFEAPPNTTPELLSQLINGLVRKHDAMRLVFDFDTQTQRVLPEEETSNFKVGVFDLTDEASEVVHHVRQEIREEMSHQVLSPEQWPLFDIRMSIAPTNQNQQPGTILHVSLDMLIMDFFSSAILANDLMEAHHQLIKMGKIHLNKPPVSFRQFVMTEQHRRDVSATTADRDYWTQRSQTFPMSGPDLPLAKRLSNVKTPRFKKIEAILSKSQLHALEANSAKHGITASAAIATAFGRVLTRYSETTTKFAINLTVFSRPAEYVGIDQVVGDFTTSILLEYNDQNSGNFSTKASKVNLQLLEDVGHAGAFSGIDFARHLRSTTGQDVVYPVVMTCVLSDFGASHSLKDIRQLLGPVTYSVSQTPQVSIDFQCVRGINGDLSVRWDYLEEAFHPGFIEEAHTSFFHMLEQLSTDAKIWDQNVTPNIDLVANMNVINRLSANDCTLRKEEEQAASSSTNSLLQNGFLQHLEFSPESPCITDTTTTITYGQLGWSIMQTIQELQKFEITSGDRIAILIPKSWKQATACLATLCLGASYVPIEVSQPKIRIETIVSEAGCKAVITSVELIEELSYLTLPRIGVIASLPALDVPKETIQISKELLQLSQRVKPDSEAYVIFTSGSTGKPKGVRMSHAGAMNTISDLVQRWNCKAHDVFFGLANLSFDLSVFDLFASMTVGARLILPSGKVDAEEWIRLVQQHQVTIWNSVPMHMQLILAALADDHSEQVETFDSKPLVSIRICLLSGDKVPVDVVRTLGNNLPSMEVFSGGGATEAGIWSILYPISQSLENTASFVPYGKPMWNQQFYILNQNFENCPTWVAGEIYIGGESLAIGYTNAEQTAKSFLEIPMADGSGSKRLYRTADFGRYLASGDIQILGRKDDQIKIRGHRIELGEIESCIMEIENVHEAAIVLSQGAGLSDISLHAFVTEAPQHQTAESERKSINEPIIRHHLEARLPRYMLPSTISIVAKLELSTNGKVDRKSLSAAIERQRQKEQEQAKTNESVQEILTLPSNNLERSIRGIWAQVLKVDPDSIGCEQDFFALGGNSLTAVRVLTAIKRTYQVKVDVATILRHPTIQAIALHVSQLGVDVDAPEKTATAVSEPIWSSLFAQRS